MTFANPQPITGEPVSYHNGSTKNPDNYSNGRPKPKPLDQRRVIAWDMEGMSLSGQDKPQHSVLFGCSAEPDNVLVSRGLSSSEMLNYIIAVGERNPQALHVGYHFNYDANMILRDLPQRGIRVLWKKNVVRFKLDGWHWTVQYFPGKRFVVTRADSWKRSFNRNNRTTVTIDDYSSFFGGKAFLSTCEQILRDDLTAVDRDTIEHGKKARGSNEWADLESVLYYWKREIELIERTFRRFRDVMTQAGFGLRQWYGPGALANYINNVRRLKPHLVAAQKPKGIMPDAVHEASKIAFSGGRFEAFQIGRVEGPVHAIDINSAYPYALTFIPSLAADNGQWRHDTEPTSVQRFGFYRIEFDAPNAVPIEFRPMPLFWRDKLGLISYPNHAVGWYASPEASIVSKMPGAKITEGWYWEHSGDVYPWLFLRDMYDTRMRLGKKNLLSLPFKLGPNSLYGKYAQTVGWNETKNEPPKLHALPIAAWITSMCRAMLWNVIQQAPDKIVAVETDSVFTTTDPNNLAIQIGDSLGQWSHDVYDEIAYVQSGMYVTKKDGEWTGVKSRGIANNEFDPSAIIRHMQNLRPDAGWDDFMVTTKPRFVGMGTALAGKNFRDNWLTWRTQEKAITFGDSGKRRHHTEFCRECEDGFSPWEMPHRTFIYSTSNGADMSNPRSLPWEKKFSDVVNRIRNSLRKEDE